MSWYGVLMFRVYNGAMYGMVCHGMVQGGYIIVPSITGYAGYFIVPGIARYVMGRCGVVMCAGQ